MDALTPNGDEGRGVAAICLGEVRSNLRSGDFRIRQRGGVNPRRPPMFLDILKNCELSVIARSSITRDNEEISLIFKKSRDCRAPRGARNDMDEKNGPIRRLSRLKDRFNQLRA